MDQPVKTQPAHEVVNVLTGVGREARDLMLEQLEFHPGLRAARISLVWKSNWAADSEGRAPLAQLRLVPPWIVPTLEWIGIDRGDDAAEPRPAPDYLLLINKPAWIRLGREDRAYLIDEALSWGGPKLDAEGEQGEDAEGRLLWIRRKAEFAGFAGPIKRHGPRFDSIRAFLRVAQGGEADPQGVLPFDEEVDEEDARDDS